MKVALLIMVFAFGEGKPSVNTYVTYPPTLALCEKLKEALPGEATNKGDKQVYKIMGQCLIDETTPAEERLGGKHPLRQI